MARKTKVTPQKEEVPEKEGPETPPDSPLLDLSEAAREEPEEEAEAESSELVEVSARSPSNPSPRNRSSAPTIPCACTCGKWAR
jgi:hypothetical protein